ncbi:MAG TPA: bifunctional methylenetetrahydrofolate dehydrogenase/methenyltetrahydrofolate cyclohydrolase FolD [Candidatus Polarisedimenticolia bacterium]|nr:bifunctional methylenetetrahydrofolate dehydrogenase/methenyltetrahydrofolate cyclohydrolase FolD [Candidatus Polarisedimenticolia bacterium]
MAARLLDGEAVARAIRQEVASDIARLLAHGRPRPKLAVVLAGADPASEIYVRNKIKACGEVGIESELVRFEGERDAGRTLEAVQRLNRRDDVDGILVQLPLPADADKTGILHALDPAKDVDGLHPENVGRMVEGSDSLRPCTPSGIMELLRRCEIPIEGARAVVLGRSDIVGKPMAILLLHASATVTICHSRTRDLAETTRDADILVAALGKPGFVTEEYLRPGVVVVDVGIHRITDVRQAEELFGPSSKQAEAVRRGGSALVGDVHPRRAGPVAGALSPVPGGVGPLTIACLLQNTVKAARRRGGTEAR